MYCGHCGTKNDDDANFCGACGCAIDNTDIVETPEPIIIDIIDDVPAIKLKDGFFFKGMNIFQKAGLLVLGLILTYIVAIIVFAIFYPQYLSYITAFFYRLYI